MTRRSDSSLLVQGPRIIDPARGLDFQGDLLVEGETITALGRPGQVHPSSQRTRTLDARGLVLCPGFIDIHAHLREPGFEQRETLETGSQAAAKGGFTTVCAMASTIPCLDTPQAIEHMMGLARQKSVVRVLPISAVTRNREGRELVDMDQMVQAGCILFSDDGNPVEDASLMARGLAGTRRVGRAISNHCEERALSNRSGVNQGSIARRLGLKGYPNAAEEAMVARDIALAELTGGHAHLCHISTRGTVELVRHAKERGVHVTAEVCPHHLTLTEEWVLGTRGNLSAWNFQASRPYDTKCKMNPPLRSRADVEACVAGLREGIVDCIATDHAPYAEEEKNKPFEKAAFGVCNFEVALAALLSLVHGGALDLPTLVHRLTVGPAGVLGPDLAPYTTLQPGTPADLVLLDLETSWQVDPEQFLSKGRNTPWHGVTLKGQVVGTLVGGRWAYRSEHLKLSPMEQG